MRVSRISRTRMRVVFKSGFTLIELLVVMAIIAILTTISLVSFRNVQIKARDGQRKSDLEQVQRALEFYLNDHGSYPLSSVGSIKVGAVTLDWKTRGAAGSEFVDANETVYMKELVGDPKASPNYCYLSNDTGSFYKIYAKLENANDPKAAGPYTCGGSSDYNYGVSSFDTTP